jgi:hypothetical protein
MTKFFKKYNFDHIVPLKNMDARPTTRYSRLQESDLSDELVSAFAQAGMIPFHIDQFYNKPYTENDWAHVDGAYPGFEYPSRAKINWIYTGPEARVRWWEIPLDEKLRVHEACIKEKFIATHYHNMETFKLLGDFLVDGTSLLEAGIPHSVHNMSPVPRWVISIMPAPLGEHWRWMTFDEVEARLDKLQETMGH